jgi:hypothetical protein
MNRIYFNNFTCLADVVEQFCISEEEVENITMIYASYDTPDYEGDAHVIFLRDGKLYEVNGSHCSCNGLENTWVPEETSALALLNRPNVAEDAKNNIKHIYRNIMCFL